MTPEAADWVYTVVLTQTYRDSCSADDTDRLIRTCHCQGGPCGHCPAGRHEQCPTRLLGPHPGPETYVVSHTGRARTAVWLLGRACAWRCPCVCPPPVPPPVEQLALVGAFGRVSKRYGQ